ncbi:2-amino-4-hydroxy-6-hydroxymethyldihydropteridine diphosphokinase [Sphingomonas abietis]|uniref:2-amino-4-hydroxy-6-hydroxymethyldihydropteridine pyrophosphokinase n=1 Tax=Sphingomonas abietis TaxID=3012344 RepID=A0ABY7NQ43_9SPHN|nr:2-amino-4-hydroxy-6-hydroxymethyldihydropteridine diphosphokinase [Sphingomonas abietis]WBO23508.1 2-amino-4-hydroxy-6-hydroxymethyldihydropteridine diphosphokinase [Sphingomonas abietis]
MGSASYVIGLGSNRPHGRHGRPEAVLRAAIAAMADHGLAVRAVSATRRTRAMGPSDRDYANAAVRVASDLPPAALLVLLKRIERDFGRRPSRRWGARVLDLDILAWSGGRYRARTLQIPHAALTARAFALGPAAEVAPGWRHPGRHRTLRQLDHRLHRRQAVDLGPAAQ